MWETLRMATAIFWLYLLPMPVIDLMYVTKNNLVLAYKIFWHWVFSHILHITLQAWSKNESDTAINLFRKIPSKDILNFSNYYVIILNEEILQEYIKLLYISKVLYPGPSIQCYLVYNDVAYTIYLVTPHHKYVHVL